MVRSALREFIKRRRPRVGTPASTPAPRAPQPTEGTETPATDAPALRPPLRCTAGPTLRDVDAQRSLEHYGFAVVPFFRGARLETQKAVAADLGAAPDDPRKAVNWSFHSRSRKHKEAVKRLGTEAADLLDATFTDHVVFLTTYITKWPGDHSAFPPHQDPTLVDERHHTGVTVWIPLVDVDVANGMLHVVPGSHRFSARLRTQDVDQSTFADFDHQFLHEHGRGVPMRAGEALIFDNRLVHFSLPNRGREERVVLSFGMRPRSGSCVVVAPDGDEVAIHEVADDFYIDVLPAVRDDWRPDRPPVATITNPDEVWTEAALDRLCRQVGTAPRATTTPTQALDADALDTGVFCALCGETDGLGAQDRAGRNNAQLRCPACEDQLAELRPA